MGTAAQIHGSNPALSATHKYLLSYTFSSCRERQQTLGTFKEFRLRHSLLLVRSNSLEDHSPIRRTYSLVANCVVRLRDDAVSPRRADSLFAWLRLSRRPSRLADHSAPVAFHRGVVCGDELRRDHAPTRDCFSRKRGQSGSRTITSLVGREKLYRLWPPRP